MSVELNIKDVPVNIERKCLRRYGIMSLVNDKLIAVVVVIISPDIDRSLGSNVYSLRSRTQYIILGRSYLKDCSAPAIAVIELIMGISVSACHGYLVIAEIAIHLEIGIENEGIVSIRVDHELGIV